MVYKLIISGVIFSATIGSGIWLNSLGKPYHQIVFNIHKFIALAFIVYTFIFMKNLFKTLDANFMMKVLLFLSIVATLLLLVSGGILSAKENPNAWFNVIHKISTTILLLSTLGWFYLVLSK